jgi:hypothetical protein
LISARAHKHGHLDADTGKRFVCHSSILHTVYYIPMYMFVNR